MMNADPRIKERLERAADRVSLDEQARLDDVARHGARRAARQRVTAAAVAIVVAAAAIAVAWYALPRLDEPPPQPIAPLGTEPTGFLVVAIDGTNSWPPPLTAVPADGTADSIAIHVPNPETSSDWDWSPDGTRLLWLRHVIPQDGRPFDQLVVSNPDGTDPKTVVDQVGYIAYRGRAWSSDSRTVAFVIMGDHSTELHVADAATGADTTISRWDRSVQIDVDWSPDATRLVVGVPDAGIFTMARDGSDQRQISDLPAYRIGWSPTGTQIVAEAGGVDGAHPGVWVLGADGSDPQRLSPRSEVDLGPVWSPDGRWIAFSRDTEIERADQPQFGTTVFLMRADGSDLRRVARAPDHGWREVWDWLPISPQTGGG
jgi:Tol biopolymer transport system component